MPCYLDHLAVTAPSLAAGEEYLQTALGVAPLSGGQHARMATHNRLLRLGADTYLEVIAADPHAPAPGRPRWFGLDNTAATAAPRLAAWIARTDDIQAATAASPVSLGEIEPMSRGETHWHIGIPEDGSLPLDGAAPMLIQWAGRHPTASLADSGCRLRQLELYYPEPKRLRSTLDAIGFRGEITISPLAPGERPRLRALIDTPYGPRELV